MRNQIVLLVTCRMFSGFSPLGRHSKLVRDANRALYSICFTLRLGSTPLALPPSVGLTGRPHQGGHSGSDRGRLGRFDDRGRLANGSILVVRIAEVDSLTAKECDVRSFSSQWSHEDAKLQSIMSLSRSTLSDLLIAASSSGRVSQAYQPGQNERPTYTPSSLVLTDLRLQPSGKDERSPPVLSWSS